MKPDELADANEVVDAPPCSALADGDRIAIGAEMLADAGGEGGPG